MDSKKMTMVSVVIFVLSLLVFVATVVLVFFKPQESFTAKRGRVSNTTNVEIGDVTTQIGSTGRYYKGYVYLEIAGKKIPAIVEKKKPQITDAILSTVSESSVKEVTGDLETVKEKIKDRVNEIIGEDLVVNVLFTESVVQ